MNETNSEEPIQLSQVQEIDMKMSNSKIDIDQNPINENTYEIYCYNNLSEDWAENNNVSLENSNKEELEALEDNDITNADDEIIYESQKRNRNEIQEENLSEEEVTRTSIEKSSEVSSPFHLRLLGLAILILGNIGLFLCDYEAVNISVDSSKEKMKDYKTPTMLVGWISIVIALYCQWTKESRKASRARIL